MAVCDNGNGIKTRLEIERRDLLKIAALVVSLLGAVFGAAVPLTIYVFQTRAQAIEEHATIEQTMMLYEQEVRLRREYGEKETAEIKTDVEDIKRISQTLDTNQRTLMRDVGIRHRRIKPRPAGIDFDDLDP